jgi:transcriptional regulator with XRE-family HTH domain
MQIKLGETIRELRKRDGRTQEALATALGVTSQAVSRWESNGSYPDVETIPAIANYFHITIDELFGYNGEREEKIKRILQEADARVKAQNDIEPCVAALREAVSEFPSETRILLQLGYAVNILGWQKHGARRYIPEGQDYAVYDIHYNAQNEHFKEALMIFSKALEMGVGADDRLAVISTMVRLYALTGRYTEAEDLAKKQDSLTISRECLLVAATEGERRDAYEGEALLALAHEVKSIIMHAVMTIKSIRRSETGIQKLLGAIHLFETILDDGTCGYGHFDLCELYFWCAVLTAQQGNVSQAMVYFDNAFEHSEKYKAIRGTGIYHYSAPLVSKVTCPSADWPKLPEWKSWLHVAPENLIAAIRARGRYSNCF